MTRLVYNGKIYLERERFCEAVLIKNGKIAKTGSSGGLLEEASSETEKIDAQGALVLPAFNDSHLHLLSTGKRAYGIETEGAKSIDDVINRGREFISKLKPPAGTYVIGAGLNPDQFVAGEKRNLRREDLDKISTEHPVIIKRHCGHVIYCNSLALKLAGLDENAPNVDGGTVDKDENGRPNGVFMENAIDLPYISVPGSTKQQLINYLILSMKNAHSLGITACASNDTSEGYDFDSITEAYRDIYDESLNSGSPALRVTLQCSISGSEELLNKFIKRDIYLKPLWETVSRDGDKAQRPNWGTFLKAGSIKLFMDGSLGGQTAWMRRPYVDKPETKGIPVLETETLNRIVRKASDNGMQVLVHAIGDAAIEAVIAAFEKVTYAGKNPLRHGVIHTQITTPDLLERMARNKILSLIQPVFLADDMPILESRVGKELALTSYAWGSMHKMGIPVSYGTDSSVCPMDPLANIQWAVLREPGEGMEIQGFPYSLTNHAEKVDVYTAVDAYTEGSAYSGYFDSIGRIAPGFFADLCFLDRDIFAIPPEGIHKAKVTRTMCAGETVFLA